MEIGHRVVSSVTMGIEIEKKFFVKNRPDELSWAAKHIIEQHYIAIDRSGTEVRVRKMDQDHYLTIKSGSNLNRLEVEIVIDSRQFSELSTLSKNRSVTKTRYVLRNVPLIILDVYEGSLNGLEVVEVEFDDTNEAQAFSPHENLPGFELADVSASRFFKNKNLSKMSPAEIKRFLELL